MSQMHTLAVFSNLQTKYALYFGLLNSSVNSSTFSYNNEKKSNTHLLLEIPKLVSFLLEFVLQLWRKIGGSLHSWQSIAWHKV